MGVIEEFRRERRTLRVSFFHDATKVVEEAYALKKGELFMKSKKFMRVEARKVLVFLCYMNGLPLPYIIELLRDGGYAPKKETLEKGLVYLEHKMATDNYYHELIYDLYEQCVSMESGKKLAEHQ